MAKEDIRHYSLKDLDRMVARGDYTPTPPDAPEIALDEDFWHNARVIMPDERNKTSIHLRVDTDVLAWFKQHGKGHLKRMNAVLRAYVETQKNRQS
jgi:uncharacterized protein (DUF4415 family)